MEQIEHIKGILAILAFTALGLTIILYASKKKD